MLLDSHVALWAVTTEERIGRASRHAMTSANTVCVSAVTQVEFEIKAMLGRITLTPHIAEDWSAAGFDILPFGIDHALALRQLPELSHHDPFDRMLLAQALTEDVPFLTADRRLLSLGHDWIIDARL